MHLPVRLVSVIAAKVDIINNILINVLRTVDMLQKFSVWGTCCTQWNEIVYDIGIGIVEFNVPLDTL